MRRVRLTVFWLVRHKAHHPFRHRRTMMVVVEAGDTLLVNLLAQRFLTKVKQGAGKVMDELGCPWKHST